MYSAHHDIRSNPCGYDISPLNHTVSLSSRRDADDTQEVNSNEEARLDRSPNISGQHIRANVKDHCKGTNMNTVTREFHCQMFTIHFKSHGYPYLHMSMQQVIAEPRLSRSPQGAGDAVPSPAFHDQRAASATRPLFAFKKLTTPPTTTLASRTTPLQDILTLTLPNATSTEPNNHRQHTATPHSSPRARPP
jgi:hypothetical protein